MDPVRRVDREIEMSLDFLVDGETHQTFRNRAALFRGDNRDAGQGSLSSQPRTRVPWDTQLGQLTQGSTPLGYQAWSLKLRYLLKPLLRKMPLQLCVVSPQKIDPLVQTFQEEPNRKTQVCTQKRGIDKQTPSNHYCHA